MATDGTFAEALRAAYATLAPGGDERFPAASGWEPPTPEVGTAKRLINPEVKAGSTQAPAVPFEKHKTQERTPAPGAAEAWVEWQERAAIREYDGGMSRETAEILTAVELGPCPPAGPVGLG